MLDIVSNLDYMPFLISIKLALITTFLLFALCVPLSWWLSQTKCKAKPILESVISLPLVLPPSVLGFYFLLLMSNHSSLGLWYEEVFNTSLLFSFTGVLIASCFYSLPFMAQPLQSGFESINKNLIEASYTSGKSTFTTLLKVVLPNIKPSIMTALIITFAHTMGEFGVVLMVGGSVPGQTKVASVAIYEFVEIMDYKAANVYSAIMLILSFLTLLGVYIFNLKNKKKFI